MYNVIIKMGANGKIYRIISESEPRGYNFSVVGGMLLMGCGQTSVPDEIADSSEKKESSVEPEKNGEEPALQKVT